MSKRMDVAKAYERALFAGRMDEVESYFTDDVSYWVAGRPPIGGTWQGRDRVLRGFTNREFGDRKSTRLNSSHLVISYAVFCLKKKKKTIRRSSSSIVDMMILRSTTTSAASLRHP